MASWKLALRADSTQRTHRYIPVKLIAEPHRLIHRLIDRFTGDRDYREWLGKLIGLLEER